MFFKSLPAKFSQACLSTVAMPDSQLCNQSLREKQSAASGLFFADCIGSKPNASSFGVMTDEDFNLVQAARAAKWPGLYFFSNGLRSEWAQRRFKLRVIILLLDELIHAGKRLGG